MFFASLLSLRYNIIVPKGKKQLEKQHEGQNFGSELKSPRSIGCWATNNVPGYVSRVVRKNR